MRIYPRKEKRKQIDEEDGSERKLAHVKVGCTVLEIVELESQVGRGYERRWLVTAWEPDPSGARIFTEAIYHPRDLRRLAHLFACAAKKMNASPRGGRA